MYVLPGFVDMHGHIGGRSQGTPAEYVFKLWLAHGITTIRDPSAGNGLDWVLDQKQKSEKTKSQPLVSWHIQPLEWVRRKASLQQTKPVLG
jgi:adenine deaminase